jgi:hypothetical protein
MATNGLFFHLSLLTFPLFLLLSLAKRLSIFILLLGSDNY